MPGKNSLYSGILSVMLLLQSFSAEAAMVGSAPVTPVKLVAASQILNLGELLPGLLASTDIDSLLNASYETFCRLYQILQPKPPEPVELPVKVSFVVALSRFMMQNPECSIVEGLEALHSGQCRQVMQQEPYVETNNEETCEERFSGSLLVWPVPEGVENAVDEQRNGLGEFFREGILVFGSGLSKLPPPAAGQTDHNTGTQDYEEIPGNDGEDEPNEPNKPNKPNKPNEPNDSTLVFLNPDGSVNTDSACELARNPAIQSLPVGGIGQLYCHSPSPGIVCTYPVKPDALLPEHTILFIEQSLPGHTIAAANENLTGTFCQIVEYSFPKYVLKFVNDNPQKNNDKQQHFITELVMFSRLSVPGHENISRLIAAVHCHGQWTMVMNHGGQDLIDWLNRSPLLVLDRCIEIALKISRAICYMHQNRIFHRDLKPENVLLRFTPQGADVQVIDFGYACLFDDKAGLKNRRFGTRGYRGPEWKESGDHFIYDEAMEIFAGGLVFAYIADCDYQGGKAGYRARSLLRRYGVNVHESPNPENLPYKNGALPGFHYICISYPQHVSEFIALNERKLRGNHQLEMESWASGRVISAEEVKGYGQQRALQLLAAMMTRYAPHRRLGLGQVMEYLESYSRNRWRRRK